MSFIDMLTGAAGGNNSIASAVTQMLAQHPGGLNGILEQLKAAGLSKQVESWIGSGQNLPITPAQVTHALGAEKIDQVAQASGLTHQEAAQHIADTLPGMVDHLTPDGEIPQGDFATQAMSFLKTNFFK